MLPYFFLDYKSPYEILFNKLPDYNSLRAFGCLCYISNLYSTSDKFASSALKCVFLGYPFNKKGYRVMDLVTRKCYVSRDIVFVEDQFHCQHSPDSSNLPMFPLLPFHEHGTDTSSVIPNSTPSQLD